MRIRFTTAIAGERFSHKAGDVVEWRNDAEAVRFCREGFAVPEPKSAGETADLRVTDAERRAEAAEARTAELESLLKAAAGGGGAAGDEDGGKKPDAETGEGAEGDKAAAAKVGKGKGKGKGE